ncbi:ribonuclease HI [Deinococcus radiophilus]|uniref:Ribonuclease H n=1 Tax=Deinococcus radiophilus TaxID=32062 RepID=A0A431W347_9DEIO|nr:ribonuclease H family protein [Deinococcus radiophilus]RTR29844.1 ribonuclease H [Deinococcus radiophilus]UFA49806.1 ribonuclease H-like domain-containing protein [Deinococcus radiophilus]
MNHAYVDASWREEQADQGRGGWGLVLLGSGELPLRMGGQLSAPDNNAAEMRAVLEAVRSAPPGEPLSIYSDNWAVLNSLSKGRGTPSLWSLREEVLALVLERGITLRMKYVPRHRRHMRSAHDLANAARLGQHTGPLTHDAAEVSLELREGSQLARVALRRPGERVTAEVPLDPLDPLPPSAQALLAAVSLGTQGETLRIRRVSKLARALWENPQRTLLPAAQAELIQAREQAEGLGVVVEFE